MLKVKLTLQLLKNHLTCWICLATYLAKVSKYISHSLKYFLETYTRSFSVCFLKFSSTTLSLVMTFSISLLQFFVVSSLTVGSLNRLTCLWRQFEEQPTNAQFSPGITAKLKLNISKDIQLFCRLKLNISKDIKLFCR